MSKVIAYYDSLKLNELEDNTIVKNVPLTHKIFWYILNIPRNDKWLKRAEEIDEFPPLYYCKKCKILEDGAHRTVALNNKGKKYSNIIVKNNCYANTTGYRNLIRTIMIKEKEQGAHIKRKDFDWLSTCCKYKWKAIDEVVKFKDKTYLDIGCQTGYSPLEGIRRGAKEAIGIDIRDRVLDIGRKAIDYLELDNVKLHNCSWEDYTPKKTDIVSCMGLIHYFPIDKYEELFYKILDNTKEIAILELRCNSNNDKNTLIEKSQVIATGGWLLDKLNKKGFELIKKVVRKPNKRELWIVKRR